MAQVVPGSNTSLTLDTKYGWSFRLRKDNATAYVADEEDE